MDSKMKLSDYLASASQKHLDKIGELLGYYEEYLETLIDSSDLSFEEFLEMEERDDLSGLEDEISEEGISIEYTISADVLGYRKEKNPSDVKTAMHRYLLQL
jgi:hypothetical protein